MADNNAPVSEPDIEDVSLIDTPIAPATDPASESADESQNQGADTEQDQSDSSGDANNDEAKESPDTNQEEGADKTQDEQPQQLTKEQRDQAARQAYLERQRNRQQVEQQIDQQFGPSSAEELIAQGVDPQQANVEALRQEIAFSQERARVAELNAGMRAEAVEVFSDFPVFNPQSKDYDPDFAQMVEVQYKQAARVQTSDDGSIILNAEIPLYDYYQQMATIYNRGTSRGAEVGQQQMADQLSRTETLGGSSSTNGPAPGSLDELEHRLADVPIT